MIPQDKALHFIVGVVVFAIVNLIAGPDYAAAAVIVAAVGKEVYDHRTGTGTAEVLDALATMAGGFTGYLCTL